MNTPNEVVRARNGYLWLLVAPFLIIATTLIIASLNLGYWVCVTDPIKCRMNGLKYLNYLSGLLPSALWYVFLLPNAFHKESAFIRKHGRRALIQAGIFLGVALLGMLLDWLALANGGVLNIAFGILVVIWLFNTTYLNNLKKENDPQKESDFIKESNLKSRNNERTAINPIWVIILVGLLAVVIYWSIYWNSLDYEVQGNLLMAGAVFLIAASPILAIVGVMVLMFLLSKADKKFDRKSNADESAQPNAEDGIKDKSK